MVESRNRRIARRVAVTVAAVILLLGAYVSSYFGLFWLRGHGSIDSPTYLTLGRTVFAPIVLHQKHHLPGWKYVAAGVTHAYWMGRGEPIPESHRQNLENNWRSE